MRRSPTSSTSKSPATCGNSRPMKASRSGALIVTDMLSSLPGFVPQWSQQRRGDKMAILDRTDTGAIARLTMNSPGNLNALSDEMLAALKAEFDRLARDRDIRVVTLAGAGKAFCAGHDLKQMQAARQSEDAGHPRHPATRHRLAARHRHRRRLPARGELRHGGRRRGHALRRQRRQYRA